MSDRWIKPRDEYFVQTGGMHQNPFGVPKDEIIRMLLENPPEISAQVIFGKYVESSGLVFKSESIQQLFRYLPGVRVMGNFWVDREKAAYAKTLAPRYDDFTSPFHTGVDLARQTDYTVITTIDVSVTPSPVVYYKRLNRVPWETIYTEIGKARALWGPNILFDSTGMGGDVVGDALESRNYCPIHQETVLVGSRCLDPHTGAPRECRTEQYLPLSCAEGFNFTGTTKKELIEHLRNCLEIGYSQNDPERDFGWLRCPAIPQLNEEMVFYTWDDKKLVTDCLFSLALAAWSGLEDPLDDPAYGSTYGV